MPVGIRAVTNGDKARNEDGGSGSKGYECEVHLFLLWRARPDGPGLRRSTNSFVFSYIVPVGGVEILTQPSQARA
jgi:hypothetical protein